MKILGIESSCDECAAAVVEDGRWILSNVIATQIPFHASFNGVVPEIASRKHCEWISGVTHEALLRAGLTAEDIDGIAVTSQPGLMGSLLVGLNFAKAFAYARRIPFIGCDHILAHLYAVFLRYRHEDDRPSPAYPFLGLLASGGHTLICNVEDYQTISVLGATVDDAVGEAFDKVSKYYGWGYPGGAAVDKLASTGDAQAFQFPLPKPGGRSGPCDLSYSGLKTAVIHQSEFFRKKTGTVDADIAASFQKAAIDTLLRALFAAVEITGHTAIVVGGGVAANSLLRARLAEHPHLPCIFPPTELCGDNAAMVAGLGYQYLSRGICSPLSITAQARVASFKRGAFR